MSDQSLTSLSDRSQRPAMFGTLTAADVGARGRYQMPGRPPPAGINFSSNGIFNLPRYYPNYERFDNEDSEDAGSTWRSGEHQRTIPFYRDQPVDDDDRIEPIYAKPNKAARHGGGGVVPRPREQFTVALGSDFDTASPGGRRCGRCCRGRRNCCRSSGSRCCKADCYGRCGCSCRRGCWSCCCCCCRKAICKVRPSCICTIVALILLMFVIVSVGLFLTVFLLVTNPGLTSTSLYNVMLHARTHTRFLSTGPFSRNYSRLGSVADQGAIRPCPPPHPIVEQLFIYKNTATQKHD